MTRSISGRRCSISSVEAKHVEAQPVHLVLELAQPVDVAVVDVDLGAHAEGDLRRVLTDDAATDHHDLAGGHAGHAAEQQAAAAERLLEHERAGLRGDLARDLAHRREQRQAAQVILDGLVGDARRAAGDEPLRLLGVGREVQVGEEGLPFAQPGDLDRLRLLDLDDHVGLGEDGVGVGDDPGTLRLVLGVADRRALAGAVLDHDLVAVLAELAHAGGSDGDAVLVGLDLGGHADLHGVLSVVGVMWRSRAGTDGRSHCRAARARIRSGRGRSSGRDRSAARSCGCDSAACGGGSRGAARRPPTARCIR